MERTCGGWRRGLADGWGCCRGGGRCICWSGGVLLLHVIAGFAVFGAASGGVDAVQEAKGGTQDPRTLARRVVSL